MWLKLPAPWWRSDSFPVVSPCAHFFYVSQMFPWVKHLIQTGTQLASWRSPTNTGRIPPRAATDHSFRKLTQWAQWREGDTGLKMENSTKWTKTRIDCQLLFFPVFGSGLLCGFVLRLVEWNRFQVAMLGVCEEEEEEEEERLFFGSALGQLSVRFYAQAHDFFIIKK